MLWKPDETHEVVLHSLTVCVLNSKGVNVCMNRAVSRPISLSFTYTLRFDPPSRVMT